MRTTVTTTILTLRPTQALSHTAPRVSVAAAIYETLGAGLVALALAGVLAIGSIAAEGLALMQAIWPATGVAVTASVGPTRGAAGYQDEGQSHRMELLRPAIREALR